MSLINRDKTRLSRQVSPRPGKVPLRQSGHGVWLGRRGTPRDDSDLDVGVVGTRKLTANQQIALIEAFAQAFGRPVDLVDLRAVRGPVLREAPATGYVVYRKDPSALGEVIRDMLIYEADEAPIFNRAASRAAERCLRTS